MNKDYYTAEVARFDKNGNGEGRCWGFYVSPGKYAAFTIDVAKELLDRGYVVIYQTAFKMFEVIEDYKFNHKVEIEKGLLKAESEKILKDFFKMLRKMK